MHDVVVIGDINMETNIEASSVIKGHYFEIGSISERIGGSAIDISVLCSYLGLKVSLVSSIGMDASGVLSILEKSNIDYSQLIISETKTGKRINIDLPGNSSSYVFTGANRHLSPRNVESRFLKGSRMVHICPGNDDMVRSISERAHDVLISCQIDGSCDLRSLDDKVNFLFMDVHDAMATTDEADASAAGRKIAGMGPQNVILTDKGKGLNVFRDGDPYVINAPVDPTYDAGEYDDSFISGFIYRYLKTSNLKSSLSFGLAFQLLSHTDGKKILFQDLDVIEDKMYSIMRSNNE
ncbi:MAG TPA: carbohydrate kinase family protein [Candidatus Methanofastidiosa archaeon]|nr:carbohydrate kinase family protein [Candidatus Methanofastidiosa archaeon]